MRLGPGCAALVLAAGAVLLAAAAAPAAGMPIPPGSPSGYAAAVLPVQQYHGAVVWTGSAYDVLGGIGVVALGTPAVPTDHVVRYVPGAPTTTTVGTLPIPIGVADAVWTGTEAYVFAGSYSPSHPGDILRYDPATATATLLPTKLPPISYGAAAVWTGSVAYIFGGEAWAGIGLAQLSRDIHRFDPATGTLTTFPDALPHGITHLGAAWDGTSAWLVGGATAATKGSGATPLILGSKDLHRFDPATGAITSYPDHLPAVVEAFHRTIWDGTHAWAYSGSIALRIDPATAAVDLHPGTIDSAQGAPAAFDGCRAHFFGGLADSAADSGLDDETAADHIMWHGPAACPTFPPVQPVPPVPPTPPVPPGPCGGCTPPAPPKCADCWPPAKPREPSDAAWAVDLDRDGVQDAADNCPADANRDQADRDRDGHGDACDPAASADPVLEALHRLGPARSPQAPAPDLDPDRDGVALAGAFPDNCPADANPDQGDADGDRAGDACDPPELPAARAEARGRMAAAREGSRVPWAAAFVGLGATAPVLAWLALRRRGEAAKA